MRISRPGSLGDGPGFFRTMAGRRLLRRTLIVVAAFVVGYLINVLFLFPGPVFEKVHAVPRVLDLGVTEARGKLESQGLRFKIEDQRTDVTAPKGTVIWQDPPPGVVVPPNSQVSLVLSEGPTDIPVPDVAGFPRALAERVLTAAGFKLGSSESVPAAPEPGIVVQTRPSAGTGRPAGTAITLVVSSGPAEVTVPGVLGLPLAVARERLEVLGLGVGRVSNRLSPGRPDGLVLQQRPSAGSRVSRGTQVDLTVTKGS
jgi:beta-lactam-binding protein with PASTA domain